LRFFFVSLKVFSKNMSAVVVDEVLGEVDDEVQRQLLMAVSKVEIVAYLCSKCAHETYMHALDCKDCTQINESTNNVEVSENIPQAKSIDTEISINKINEDVLSEWSRKERIRAEQDLTAWMRARALIAERERLKIIGTLKPDATAVVQEEEEEGEEVPCDVDETEEWKRWFGDQYEDIRTYVMSDDPNSQKPKSQQQQQGYSLGKIRSNRTADALKPKSEGLGVMKRKRGRPSMLAKKSSVSN
jgi:hypothetical protein